MQFFDKTKPHGHLQISKRFPDGSEELVFDDHNVITSGLGQSIAQFMSVDCSEDPCIPTTRVLLNPNPKGAGHGSAGSNNNQRMSSGGGGASGGGADRDYKETYCCFGLLTIEGQLSIMYADNGGNNNPNPPVTNWTAWMTRRTTAKCTSKVCNPAECGALAATFNDSQGGAENATIDYEYIFGDETDPDSYPPNMPIPIGILVRFTVMEAVPLDCCDEPECRSRTIREESPPEGFGGSTPGFDFDFPTGASFIIIIQDILDEFGAGGNAKFPKCCDKEED